MIVTVSTVKDRLDNVQRFVEGNLAGGVDHMLVFLDAPEPAVEAWLAERPEVTTVVTDDGWWNSPRPKLLNRRQNINANLAKSVLAREGWASWLFHIDADEIVRIDRAALDAVKQERPAVGLRPLEVVSTLEQRGEPSTFKRLLDDDELSLLAALGLVAEPSNSRYFRSHIAGKVGVRPQAKVWLGIHKATDEAGERVPLVRLEGLRMLHLESYSGEEFVRKWTNMVTSGPSMHFGAHRQMLATALKKLVELDLPTDVKSHYLTQFYERHMAEPIEDLARLGLLEEIDVRQGDHRAQLLTAEQRAGLRARIETVRPEDKRSYMPPSRAQAEEGSPPGGGSRAGKGLPGLRRRT